MQPQKNNKSGQQNRKSSSDKPRRPKPESKSSFPKSKPERSTRPKHHDDNKSRKQQGDKPRNQNEGKPRNSRSDRNQQSLPKKEHYERGPFKGPTRPYDANKLKSKTDDERVQLPSEIKLPTPLVNAWRETLIKISKLPPGTNPKDENRNALAGRILATQSSDISHLWETFTTERGELIKNLLSTKRMAAAYLGGFHLANAARVQMLLDRAEKRSNLKNVVTKHAGHLVWNDFGCGTGAIAQTIAAKMVSWKPDMAADFHLTDTTSTLLDIAELATRSSAPNFKVLKHKKAIELSSIESMMKGKDHTLFGYSLGYVWNELKKNKKAQSHLLELFGQHIANKHEVLIIILEPANQIIARDAMTLRNDLVAQGYSPIYPCPSSKSCPMLERSRDWCFSEGSWTSPLLMQNIEKNLGIDRSRFSTAAYLFASPELSGKILPTGKISPVVVGRPQKISDKGLPIRGFEMLLCDGDKLFKKPGSTGKNFLMRGHQSNS
jgi:hypothetical protein